MNYYNEARDTIEKVIERVNKLKHFYGEFAEQIIADLEDVESCLDECEEVYGISRDN